MAVRESRDLGSKIKLGAMGLASLVLLAFIALNFDKVEVDLILGSLHIQLAFALILAALLGFVIGYFFPKRRSVE
jgi:uncharacterized integral membrane protein